MQAQTEPKLHPETANTDFEQVITKRSATLKGDLKVNLEPVFLEISMLGQPLRRPFGWIVYGTACGMLDLMFRLYPIRNVCMYVCMYVYVCVCICICIYVYVYCILYTVYCILYTVYCILYTVYCICIYVYAYVYVYMYVWTKTCAG